MARKKIGDLETVLQELGMPAELGELHRPSPPMTAADTPSREELLNGLIQDALDELHHDATEGSDVDLYERQRLRQKLALRLAAKPADDGVREATTEEMREACARLVETTGLNNKDNIARDIRAISTKAP